MKITTSKEAGRCLYGSDPETNYLAWIANLGVVPLFLFAAFLLAPAFFFFLSLLFSVTHVLETICQLLSNRNNRCNFIKLNSLKSHFKPSFLPTLFPGVKEIFILIPMIFLLMLPSSMSWAQENSDYILGKGQSQSFKFKGIRKFNVGNKEVLAYQFDEKTKTLTVRGNRLGTSEVLIWDGEIEPKRLQFFVISKIQEAKFLHLAELLGSLGLKTKVHPPYLQVSGSLTSLRQYLQFKQIEKSQKDLILDETEIDLKLKSDILGEIYQLFFNDYKDSIKCQVHHSEITCFYPANEAPVESLKKYLSERFKISFIEYANQKLRNNYLFKLKLIQLEQLDGEELRLGLEQLSASLGDLLRTPINRIVEKNAVLLAQKKVEINTLAEPSGLIRPMSPAEFQIGADIPYSTTNKEGSVTQTQWQFAGLKVKVLLENMGDQVKITYETELTKPADNGATTGSIGGNKEKSSVVINLNAPTKLFQVSLKTDALGVDKMPFLNRIPILGELFKSKSSQSNYKMITGIIEVTSNE